MAEITLESLAAQVAEMSVKLEAKDGELAALKGKIVELSSEATVKPEIPQEPVSFKNKKYKFTMAQFTLTTGEAPRTVTAEEAAVDESILAEIFKIPGQGILKEVV